MMGKAEAEAQVDVRVPVASDSDIVQARCQGRALAEQMGFSPSEATLVATAISELARNIIHYAKSGEIRVERANGHGGRGITIIASDDGPGIPDTRIVVREGYSTSAGLGLGLPGVRRIMDEFEIVSKVGCGTTVTATKWLRR